jgi:hypothetical protein
MGGGSCGNGNKLAHTTPNTVVFDSVDYSTGPCFGLCPEYRLRVYRNQRFKLYASKVYYLIPDSFAFHPDSSRMGYFAGTVADTLFKRLNTEIVRMKLDSLQNNGSNCCDAPMKSFTVYYKGRSKNITSMFPPPITYHFINALSDICVMNPMRRTTDTFYRAP